MIIEKIGKRTNWIVTSPEISSIFETATSGMEHRSDVPFNVFGLGIQYVGTVNKTWKLYKDPLFRTAGVMIGYKGESDTDAGFIYAPEVPLRLNTATLDPNSFCPRNTMKTNVDCRFVENGKDYYGVINVEDFVV